MLIKFFLQVWIDNINIEKEKITKCIIHSILGISICMVCFFIYNGHLQINCIIKCSVFVMIVYKKQMNK